MHSTNGVHRVKPITRIKKDYKSTPATARRPYHNPHWPLRWAALGIGSVVLGVVMAKTHDPDPAPVAEVPPAQAPVVQHEPLSLPGTPATPEPAAHAPQDAPPKQASAIDHWRDLEVGSGDTLARLLGDEGVGPRAVHDLATAGDEGHALARLYPGEHIRLGFDADGRLQRLVRRSSPERRVVFERTEDGFAGRVVQEPLERRLLHARGQIDTSLFEAGADAGISDRLTMELVDIFRWDIDFIYNVRAGDRFAIVYEAYYKDGDKVKTGDIVAAEFVNQGEVHRAIRYERKNGDIDYFAPDGTSMRKAFLRTPVEFTRISSRYGRRYHPILHKTRMHDGVDYAAARGTPVHATGAGRIVFRGRNGGYGNMVVVKHAGKYSTAYGHMNHFRRGQHVGTRVDQGDVIGYVGSTGLSTGPHLHYEFRINGVHRNPLKVEFPSVEPIAGDEMDRFRQAISPLVAQLDTLNRAYAELDR